MQSLAHPAVRLMARLAIGIFALAWIGCATNNSPLPQRYGPGGIPYSLKRLERYPERNFVNHWLRKAYCKPGKKFGFEPGSDQATTFATWGSPDWLRKPFRSLQNERVQEWLYIEKQHVFQFVGDKLVFEGPLTDYEQILLSRGYPDRVEQTRLDTGADMDIFVYNRVFWPLIEEFYFMNGTIVQSQEGN